MRQHEIILKRTGENILVPAFKEGDYSNGVLNTLNEISVVLTNPDKRAEINEIIDEPTVTQILEEIGYSSKEGNLDKNLVAYYIADTEIAAADVRNRLKNDLPDYMIPTIFRRIESFPLTENGKVDRKALRNLAALSKESQTGYVAPETEFEQVISEIWSEVLQVEKTGVHDHFLELGGNSLAAIRITSRINNTFDLTLPVNTVFEYSTISQLAGHIEKAISKLLADLNR